jgi:hypothetical protein
MSLSLSLSLSKVKKVEPSSLPSAVVNSCVSEVTLPQQMVQQSVAMMGCPQVHVESKAVSDTKALAAELCRFLYTLGWVSGTGGSIALRVHDDSVPWPAQLIVMAPSGMDPPLSLSLSAFWFVAIFVLVFLWVYACV